MRLSLQSLGVHVRVAPGPEVPKGRSQGSWSHHQEQDDSAESDAPHVASEQGLERAIVPFPEPEPGKRNDAAAPGVEEDQGDTQVVFNANKVSLCTPAISTDLESPCTCSSDQPCKNSMHVSFLGLTSHKMPPILTAHRQALSA